MTTDGSRHEFRIVLDGIELADEHRESLSAAMNEAAARVVASLDLSRSGAGGAVFVDPSDSGFLDLQWDGGIWFALRQAELEQFDIPGRIR